MADKDILIEHLERALGEIAQDNTKVLVAELVSIITQIQQGQMLAAAIVWRWDKAPGPFRELIKEKVPGGDWIILVPDGEEIPACIVWRDEFVSLPTGGKLLAE